MRLNSPSLLPAVAISVSLPAGAVPDQSFSISATNVTLPTGATSAASQITLTSINGYTGLVGVTCQYSGGEMNAKVPNCGGGPLHAYTITANQSTQGQVTFYPYGTAVPAAARNQSPAVGKLTLTLVLAGVGFLGAFRRRNRGILALLLGAVFITGISSCTGGNSLSGTFPFTVTAVDTKTGASASASITVTVP